MSFHTYFTEGFENSGFQSHGIRTSGCHSARILPRILRTHALKSHDSRTPRCHSTRILPRILRIQACIKHDLRPPKKKTNDVCRCVYVCRVCFRIFYKVKTAETGRTHKSPHTSYEFVGRQAFKSHGFRTSRRQSKRILQRILRI